MFKVNHKGTRTTSVSTDDFEQVSFCWINFKIFVLLAFLRVFNSNFHWLNAPMVLLQFALTFPPRAFQKVTLKEKLKLIFSLRLGLGREGLTITYKHLGFVSYYILNIRHPKYHFSTLSFFFFSTISSRRSSSWRL